MSKLLSRGWMEVNDHTFCICTGSYCGLSSFPAISRENLTTGFEVQQSPLPRNSWTRPRHAMRSHHGATHQSAWPVYPRIIWGRQIQVYGRPHPSPSGTWCNRQPKNLVHMQRKLGHPLLRWPAPTVEVPFWPPCFYWFFGSCFGSHDEAGLLAFEALQELPPRHAWYCGRNQQQSAASGC